MWSKNFSFQSRILLWRDRFESEATGFVFDLLFVAKCFGTANVAFWAIMKCLEQPLVVQVGLGSIPENLAIENSNLEINTSSFINFFS